MAMTPVVAKDMPCPVVVRSTSAHGSIARLAVPAAPVSPDQEGSTTSWTLARAVAGVSPMPRKRKEAPAAPVVCAGVALVQAVPLRKARIVWAKVTFCCVTVRTLEPREPPPCVTTSVLKFS